MSILWSPLKFWTPKILYLPVAISLKWVDWWFKFSFNIKDFLDQTLLAIVLAKNHLSGHPQFWGSTLEKCHF